MFNDIFSSNVRFNISFHISTVLILSFRVPTIYSAHTDYSMINDFTNYDNVNVNSETLINNFTYE